LIGLSRYGSEAEAAAAREPLRVTAQAIAAPIRRGLRLESYPGRGIPGSEGNRHAVAPARFDHRTPNIAHVYPHVLLPESNLPPPQFPPLRRPSVQAMCLSARGLSLVQVRLAS
jgi:hypothetical protein